MPIISVVPDLSSIVPISRTWTYWKVNSVVKLITNSIGDEVQTDDIRHYVNFCISNIADMIKENSEEHYGVVIKASLEDTQHPSYLDWIDLEDTANGGANNVANRIDGISGVSVPNVEQGTQYTPYAFWNGSIAKWDMKMLTHMKSNLNLQHRHTVAYNKHGNHVLFYIGSDISSPVNDAAAGLSPTFTFPTTFVAGQSVKYLVLWAQRKPLLDDMLPPSKEGMEISATFRRHPMNVYPSQMPDLPSSNYIDLPDKHVKLLIDMTCDYVYKQSGKATPEGIVRNIDQGTQGIYRSESKEMYKRRAESEEPYNPPEA